MFSLSLCVRVRVCVCVCVCTVNNIRSEMQHKRQIASTTAFYITLFMPHFTVNRLQITYKGQL